LTKIIPNIPRKDIVDNQNTFPYWGFISKRDVQESTGKLLMLDIDFGRYCSLACSGCFRRDNVVDHIEEGDLTYDELIAVIDDAIPLGLESIKICGVGEPTENTRFLQFIRDMTERDVGVAIFTKGQVLGDDEATARFNKKYGITSARKLCETLYELKTSVMLGFQSFYTEVQDAMVGKQGHTLIRNKALENLVKTGFNNSTPTRLALCNAPFTRENYGEVFDLYVFARQRNIYPINAVLMTAGEQVDGTYLQEYDMADQEKIDLWTEIYSWNIEHRLQTLEQIREEGISVLPGAHPCNQLGSGLYLTAKGNVVGCTGLTMVQGNVRTKSIAEIWEQSKTRREMAGKFNCHCPPKDGITIPHRLYSEVLQNLEQR
jgi:MoaA/NifB/PqqE/SkfB family radical SAM enzyme